MNLFIDSISDPCVLILFDGVKKIQAESTLDIRGNESSKLIPEIDTFLLNHGSSYDELNHIICVNGPGSFTGVRTTVLIANSLAYLCNITVTGLNYFKLFDNYPIIKSSSRRDCFVKKSKQSDIEIIENIGIESYLNQNNISEIYGETNYNFENVRIVDSIDYTSIIQKMSLLNTKRIEPLYIKKPNIS
ncbi:MAG: tRNA (adenosine(37)-N6)-threonylcarbamoyltransferase complex dimerization subunit type 1 TsaB [Candidatus Gracilibacteria bacterium]|nr:tRNA (adenosine(37)-N6)-threonylcarbamoyltransferase complex dimerization subunit type 1 TsaB [Candidatus Gracilibacteria bacterium]